MDIDQVRQFLTVCETENFTRAAQQCGLSQSALSRSIARLEASLGGILFERNRRAAVRLTPLGHLMRPYLETIAREYSSARASAALVLGNPDSIVRVGFDRAVGARRWLVFLRSFRRQHPQVAVVVSEIQNAWNVERMVLRGEIDVGISVHGQEATSTTMQRELCEQQYLLAVSRQHPLAAKGFATIGDLEGATCFLGNDLGLKDAVQSTLGVNKVAARLVVEGAFEEWILSRVATSSAVAIVPEDFLIASANILLLPLYGFSRTRTICSHIARGKALGAVTSLFLDQLHVAWPPGFAADENVFDESLIRAEPLLMEFLRRFDAAGGNQRIPIISDLRNIEFDPSIWSLATTSTVLENRLFVDSIGDDVRQTYGADPSNQFADELPYVPASYRENYLNYLRMATQAGKPLYVENTLVRAHTGPQTVRRLLLPVTGLHDDRLSIVTVGSSPTGGNGHKVSGLLSGQNISIKPLLHRVVSVPHSSWK